jgi:hypothetical protein
MQDANLGSPEKRRIRFLTGAALFTIVVSLFSTNKWFTAVDDECDILGRAAQPALQTIKLYLYNAAKLEHPPLYDLILHGWLRLTGGQESLLRLPSIVFFALGAWALSMAAARLGGPKSQLWTLLLMVAWPYGFHFGRLACWYSFCFLIVSLLTLSYLRFVGAPAWGNWAAVVVLALALVYANYFGWALLACLCLDFLVRNFRTIGAWWYRALGTGILVLIFYAPIFRTFLREIHTGVHANHSVTALVFMGIYNFYCIFVSESVAPWFWPIGVPAGIAALSCFVFTLWGSTVPARRFLLYFTGLLVVMTMLGVVTTKRMMLIAAWLILAMAVALGSWSWQRGRRLLAAAVAIVFAAGWFGIVSRKLYAAPHWIEPWESIAQESAGILPSGGVVIGNNPSFFFYLTFLVPHSETDGFKFGGFLPESVRSPGVYDPQLWLSSGSPVGSTTLLVKGQHFDIPEAPTDEAQARLDARCNLISDRRLVHDPGAYLKRRYAPEDGQLDWRIEIREYSCH